MADDEEDDEVYVVVELSGVIDAKVLDLADKRCSILGVETPEPVLKLGSYLFTGEYRDATGTCVLFEETEAAGECTSSASESRNSSCRQKRQKLAKELRYFGKTEKRLHMSTSFLQEKAKPAESAQEAAKPGLENTFTESEEEAIGEAAEPAQEAVKPDRENSSTVSQEEATVKAAEPVQETDKKTEREKSPTEMAVDDS
uniref:Transcription factor TFIIIC triple barrel domain-containing protein n=1 Tax=Rhipicephalus pulchellus TaxID=72859 RepID=L7LZC4_RHIPC